MLPTQIRAFAKPVVEAVPLSVQLDNLMKNRTANKSGFINLPGSSFKKLVERAESAEDIETLKLAHVNFLGHRNLLPLKLVDGMLMKALEVGAPAAMNEWFINHEALVYHPSTKVI